MCLHSHHTGIFLSSHRTTEVYTSSYTPVLSGIYLGILHIHLDSHTDIFLSSHRTVELSIYFFIFTCFMRYLSKHTAHTSRLPSYWYLHTELLKWVYISTYLPVSWGIYLRILHIRLDSHHTDILSSHRTSEVSIYFFIYTCFVSYLSRHIAHTSRLPSYWYPIFTQNCWSEYIILHIYLFHEVFI